MRALPKSGRFSFSSSLISSCRRWRAAKSGVAVYSLWAAVRRAGDQAELFVFGFARFQYIVRHTGNRGIKVGVDPIAAGQHA